MAERFSVATGAVASGTNKTLVNLFNPAATPTTRGLIQDLILGSGATPADLTATFRLQRSTGVGTEGSGLVPHNIGGGPAGAYDSGLAHTGEPTYTANQILLEFPLHQRATMRWCPQPGAEPIMAATQNNGAGLYSSASGGTQTYDGTLWFQE